jgi:hypothetical protein
MARSQKWISYPTVWRCRPGVRRNFYRRFGISANLNHLGWIDAPHYETLKSLEKTQWSKKIKLFFNQIMVEDARIGTFYRIHKF